MIVACIQERSSQPGYIVLRTLESPLMKACKKGHFDENKDVICNLFHSDVDKEQLRVQLQLLGANFDMVTADEAVHRGHYLRHA